MKNAALIYTPALGEVVYSENHPFRPSRYRDLMNLLKNKELLPPETTEIIAPTIDPEDALLGFHSPEYLGGLREADAGGFQPTLIRFGLGTGECPIFPGVNEFAKMTASGTLTATLEALGNGTKKLFNPAGGFHHAKANHAEGFCYLNDLVAAARAAVNQGNRVAIVDLDAHHGNGTQDAFYNEDQVLTISLHESGKFLFPWGGFEQELGEGKGKGFNVNVPLLPKTDSDAYLWIFNEVVPPLLKRFQPDIVFLVMGGDVLAADPLTHLRCTNHIAKPLVNAIASLCPKIVMMGSGGYNEAATVRYWALAWAALAGLTIESDMVAMLGGVFLGEQELEGGDLLDMKIYLTGSERDVVWDHITQLSNFFITELGI
jgi:acetoin utilization protein AcuC